MTTTRWRLCTRWFAASTAFAALAAPGVSASQSNAPFPPARTLATPATCVRCIVRIDTLAVLRSAPGDSIPRGKIRSAAVNSKGFLFVSASGGDNRIAIFDEHGTLVRRLEPARSDAKATGILTVAVGSGDSLYVVDNSSEHLTVFDAALRARRTVPFEVGFVARLERLSDGNFLVASDIRTPDAVGMPFQVVSPSGVVLRSFGAPDTGFVAEGAGGTNSLLVRARDGSYWTTPQTTGQLRNWGRTLAPIQELDLQLDHLGGPTAPIADRSKQQPHVFDLQTQSCNQLWIASYDPLAVPLGNPGYDSVRNAAGDLLRVTRSPDRLHRTVLDLVDTKERRHLGRFALPVNLVRLLPNDLALAASTDDSGRWHTAIVRITVRPLLGTPTASHAGCTTHEGG